MSKRTLDDWLAHLMRQHPKDIELGLERVGQVWQNMGAPRIAKQVVTVGGTNGKGSTSAYVDALARAAGWRTGRYNSPHIRQYHERIHLDDEMVTDAMLLAAFERIDAARGDMQLTFFEYGTLAAFDVFAQHDLDLAILEVGLGGRLDATNLIDADVAIITSIGLDHTDWLGKLLDDISREKAGIARAGRPVIVSEPNPPQGLRDALADIQADALWMADSTELTRDGDQCLLTHDGQTHAFTQPFIGNATQAHNAAAAWLAAKALNMPMTGDAVASAMAGVRLPARLMRLHDAPMLLLDVAHNPQAAGVLAEYLEAHPCTGKTHLVFACLSDKDAVGMIGHILPYAHYCWLAGLFPPNSRAQSSAALFSQVERVLGNLGTTMVTEVGDALSFLWPSLGANDRVVVFGSFHTVKEAWDWFDQHHLTAKSFPH